MNLPLDPGSASIICHGCGQAIVLAEPVVAHDERIVAFVETHRAHRPFGFEFVLKPREAAVAGALAGIPSPRVSGFQR